MEGESTGTRLPPPFAAGFHGDVSVYAAGHKQSYADTAVQFHVAEFVDLLCIDELGYMELDRRGAELLFQVLTEREEKNSVAIASNESFSKAHMFRRTRARCCLNTTGSKRIGRPRGRT